MTDILTPDEQAMLVDALDEAVAAPSDLRRSLAAVGWEECLQGAPVTTVSTVARAQGRLLTNQTVLDDVLLAAAGAVGRADAVLLPPLTTSGDAGELLAEGARLHGIADAGRAVQKLLVPLRSGDAVLLAVVRHEVASASPVGMDLDRALVPVQAVVDEVELVPAEWAQVRAAGHRFLALELCGVTTTLLRLAVEHTTTREQFGRPLAAFQAVKHKLADVRTWLECAELACDAAFEDDDPVAAALAKSLAVRASRTAREHCQQVLGGMGFSWEHSLHRFIRRALVLEPLLGSAPVLRADIGRQLRATGQLPALATL